MGAIGNKHQEHKILSHIIS